MNPSWEPIVAALRAELQEYGGLLSLFAEQQDNLRHRDADAALALAEIVESQAEETTVARIRRELLVSTFATYHRQPAGSSLRDLLPFFPSDVQPLLSALIDEINHLAHRVRRDARQNAHLLARAIEFQQETLRIIRPEAFKSTFSTFNRLRAAIPAGNLRATG